MTESLLNNFSSVFVVLNNCEARQLARRRTAFHLSSLYSMNLKSWKKKNEGSTLRVFRKFKGIKGFDMAIKVSTF